MRRIALISFCAALALALIAPAASFAGSGLRFFHTADGNINCGMVKGQKKNKKKKRPRLPGEARCDVKNHTWVAPPKPKYCDVDWGFGAAISDKGVGGYVCAGDTVALPNSPVLAAGASLTLGRYTCSVPVTPGNSVRCTNNLTTHGFEVSANAISLF
jgi:hypothetical protein